MRAIAAAVVVLGVGCAQSPTNATIDRVVPSSSPSNVEMAVRLEGGGFRLPILDDLESGDFDVGAMTVALGGMPLTNVVWHDEHAIDATVPAGLPPGRYDVELTLGPRHAVLHDGFVVSAGGLAATLTTARLIGRGTTFSVFMTVTNPGTMAVDAVAPSLLVTEGSATVELATPPAQTMAIDAGQSATFVWAYRALTEGDVAFAGNASGTDVATGYTIESAQAHSPLADVLEAKSAVTELFGDGTPFSYVTAYRGAVIAGPNQAGSAAFELMPDFSLSQIHTFSFARDAQMSNSQSTQKTVGSSACAGTSNMPQCGPDNEDGRGTFTSAMLGGEEWLVLAGGKSSGDVDYIYMTKDTDAQLDFRFVDLNALLGPATKGVSAAHALGNRLYLGFPDTGGSRPYLLALSTTPPAPGLDATTADAVDLRADSFPGWQATNEVIIDSMADLGGLLYVASAAGIMAATVPVPRDHNAFPGDWAAATPNDVAVTLRQAVTTTKQADLLPTDKAYPQMAAFGGHLFVGRNTTSGPQLLACDPAGGSVPTRCEPGDWKLVAHNTTGDLLLSQLDDPSFTAITMVTATPEFLYVGFDSASGVQVFRTKNPAAATAADFEGKAGCSAADHVTSCSGLGGPGIGAATSTKIMEGKALTFATGSSVWITLGNGTGATRLVVLP